jgi:hypothetical protein
VSVAETVPANQDRISSMNMPYEGGMVRLKWLEKQLVQLETACD